MDAVIIGGGLIGLSTAWRLAQQGRRVAVWDAGRLGAEASWAGAGMLAPGGEMEQRSWWGDLAVQSLLAYPEFVRELAEEAGSRIDYRACGALQIAATDREWEQVRARAGKQLKWGIRSEEAGGRKLFYPDDAAVDPRDLLRALRTACERRGVEFREAQKVQEIVVASGRVVQPEQAEVAVLAAGAWSSAIPICVEGEQIAVEKSFPVRGHLIAFAAGIEAPGPILRQGHTYILERSNGVAIAGSTTERVGYLREPDPAQLDDIEGRARDLMPGLSGRPRTDTWIGFRPGTASGEPQLRGVADAPVYLAYGHYRNGILMAPATAEWIARAISASSQTDSTLHSAHPESGRERAGSAEEAAPTRAPDPPLRPPSTAGEFRERPDRSLE